MSIDPYLILCILHMNSFSHSFNLPINNELAFNILLNCNDARFLFYYRAREAMQGIYTSDADRYFK